MKFIARKYVHGKLYPEGEEGLRRAEAAEGFLINIRTAWIRLCYNQNFQKLKDDFEREIPDKFHALEHSLTPGRDWAASELSYVDFGIAESMDVYETLFPGCFDGLPDWKKEPGKFFRFAGNKKVPDFREVQKVPH